MGLNQLNKKSAIIWMLSHDLSDIVVKFQWKLKPSILPYRMKVLENVFRNTQYAIYTPVKVAINLTSIFLQLYIFILVPFFFSLVPF